jgi:hypothetical protein
LRPRRQRSHWPRSATGARDRAGGGSPPSTRRAFSLPAGVVALEISSRNARVAALQKRWDRLRAGLDLILYQRGADMADMPGGASGSLVRGYRAIEPTGW